MKKDVVLEATMARSILTKAAHRRPSPKLNSAMKAMQKIIESAAADLAKAREALAAEMKQE